MIFYAVLVIVIYLLIWWKLVAPYNHWKKLGVNYIEPSIFFGNLRILNNKAMVEVLQDLYKSYPDSRYVGIYQFLEPTLLIRDPKLIKEICIKEFDSFMDHRNLVDEQLDPLWNGNLVAMNGDKWRFMRSSMSPAFTGTKIKFLFDLVQECGDRLTSFLNEKHPTDGVVQMELADLLTRFTNDVISTTAFGLKVDSLRNPDNEVYNKGGKAVTFRGILKMKFFLSSISPALMKLLNIKMIGDATANFFTKVILETIKKRKLENIVRPDMLHLLMQTQKITSNNDKESKKSKFTITDEDVVGQAFLFFLAGYDSESVLLTFAIYELATNPDVQQRLYQEIRETLQNSPDGKLTYDSLNNMKYLHMVISETLRKWAPVPVTDRKVTKRFVMEAQKPGEKSFVLEKGSSIWIPFYPIHRDPKYFPEPDRFCPERFSDENKNNFNQYAYMPFGIGPRFCLGSRLAMLEGKILVANVLRHFEVVPVERTLIPIKLGKTSINATADGALWMGFKRRTDAI